MLEEDARIVAPFELHVVSDRETVRVNPTGELDLATAPQLRERVKELLDEGYRHLVISLEGLSFMDVAGVRLLLCLNRDAQRDGWQLSLVQGGDAVRRIFVLTGTLGQLPFGASAGAGVIGVSIAARFPSDPDFGPVQP